MKELTKEISAEQIAEIETLQRLLSPDELFWKNLLLKAWGADSPGKLKSIEAEMSIWEMEEKAIQLGLLQAHSRKGTALSPLLDELHRMKRAKVHA